MRRTFRPEFLNRVDEIVFFQSLTAAQIGEILGLQIDELNRRLGEQRIRLEFTEEARRHLAVLGYDPTYGARPLKRVIQRLVENPLAQGLLAGTFSEGDVIRADLEEGTSSLAFHKIDRPVAETVDAASES